MSNSLYNPFLFSAFHDRRTFKNDEPSGNDDNDDKPAAAPATTNQDRINEIYASSDNPWETNGAELNSLLEEGRSETYSGATTTTTTSNTSSNNNTGVGAGNQFDDGTTSLGAVSTTGQYAGDGYEFVQNDNTNALTRRYTGANEDAGLGTDIIAGGTSDKNTKEAIANISLNEGSSFANSAASATDGSVLDLFRDEEDKVGSDSYAEQIGQIDYTPTITYDSTKTGAENNEIRSLSSGQEYYVDAQGKFAGLVPAAPAAEPETFGDAFAENRAAGNETFTYNGNLYTTDLAPETPATPSFSYDAFGNAYDTPEAAAQADQVAAAQSTAAQNAITAASNAALDPRGDQIQSSTSNGAGIASLGEDDVMSQPVVTSASQDYLDSLPDFSYDFTAGDAATGGGRDVDADLGIGGSEATVTAAELLNDDIASDNITTYGTPGGGGVTLSDDNTTALDQIISGDQTASTIVSGGGATSTPVDLSFGSPLPGDNVVTDLSGFASYTPEQFVTEAGPTAVDIVAAASPQKYYDAFGNEFSTPDAAAESDRAAEAAVAAAIATPQTDYGFTDYMGDLYKSVVGGGYETAAGKTSGAATGIDLLYNSGVFDQLGQGVMVNSSIPGLNAQVQEKLTENNALAAANPRSPTASRDYVADTVASLRAKGGEYAASVTPEMIERIANAMPDMRPGKEGLDVTGRKYGTDLTATSLIAAGEAVDTLADIGIVAAGTATGLAPLAIGAVGATSLMEAGGAAADEVSQMIDQAAQLGQIKNADGSAVNAEQLAEIKRVAQGQAYAGAGGIAAFSDPLVAATLGTGKITQGILKSPFMVQQLAKMGITAGSEFGSGYGEQVATNIAGQGAGVDVGTTEGATGSGLLELTGGVGAGTVSTGVDTAGRLLSRGPDQVIAEQRQAGVLDPSKFPTSGQIADSSVQSSYDSVITPPPEELLAITDQTETASESRITAAEELMRSQIDQTGVIRPDELQKVQDAFGLTKAEITTAAENAIDKKMNDDANSLRARAEQSVIDTGGIPAELNAEINDLLSENPDVAASIVDDAFNRPFISNTGQSRLQMASGMDAAPVVDTAPVSQPTVMDVSPAQQAINYGAMQAQEAAYTAAKGATGDDAAAEAAGEAAYNSFLRNPSGLPEAPTEGIAPKVDTTSVGAASIARAPASGIENVVAEQAIDKKMDADNAAANKMYSYGGTGAPQTYEEVVENAKSSAKNSQEVEDAYFEVFDANQGNLDLIEINRLAAEKTDPIIDRLVQEEIARDYTVVDNKMDADNAAPAVEKEDVAAVVEVDNTAEDQAAADQTDDGVEVEIADDLFDAASKADQDVVTVNSDGTATVAVDPNAVSTGTDLVVVPETTTDVTVAEDKTTDVAVVPETTTDVAVVPETTTDVAVVPETTTDVAVVPETTTTTDVVVDPTVDLVTYTDVEDDPAEVEVEDEVEEPGGDVTVDLDEDDTFVPVVTTTDENGDTITECPEGYIMVEGPDGPMCQKSVTTTVRRQRAGAGTRAYTGLSGNRGRVGPGQRSKENITTTTETVSPTTRSA